jgi:hypothetical protein
MGFGIVFNFQDLVQDDALMKLDKEYVPMRQVETESGEILKEKIGALAFFEISSKTGFNVDKVVEFIENLHV